MSISDLYRGLVPLPSVSPSELAIRPGENKVSGPEDFKKLLNEELKLSRHAETRIQSRQIPWNENIQEKIKLGLEKAEQKGSKETLILSDSLAVIVNVKTKTIITAMDPSQLKEKVFTNIDSTVLI